MATDTTLIMIPMMVTGYDPGLSAFKVLLLSTFFFDAYNVLTIVFGRDDSLIVYTLLHALGKRWIIFFETQLLYHDNLMHNVKSSK